MQIKSLSNGSPTAFAIASLLIVFIVYSIVLSIGTVLVAGFDTKITADNRILFLGILALSQFFIIGAGAFTLVRWLENEPQEVFSMRKPFSPKFYLFAIIGIAGLLTAYDGLFNILLAILPESALLFIVDSYNTETQTVASIIGEFSFATFLFPTIAIAVAPAISEELLFRGFLLSNLQRNQTKLTAIIISGILFGLIHFSIVNIVALSAIGMFLAFITIRSGSIYPAIILHFLNNLMSVVQIFIENGQPELIKAEEYASIELLSVTYLIIGLAVLVASIIMINKLSAEQVSTSPDQQTV